MTSSNMTSQHIDFTWQTLYEHIEGMITDLLNILQSLEDHPRLKLDEIYTTSFEDRLAMLRSCLLLVSEMQKRENLHDICPIMSLDTIRLHCRHRDTGFAQISPLADGRYRIVEVGMNEHEESGKLRSLDMNLIQIVDEVEKLAKRTCIGE